MGGWYMEKNIFCTTMGGWYMEKNIFCTTMGGWYMELKVKKIVSWTA